MEPAQLVILLREICACQMQMQNQPSQKTELVQLVGVHRATIA